VPYALLFELAKYLFGAVLTLAILVELYTWRPRRKRDVWRNIAAARSSRRIRL
jgi:hypothetical protein